MQKRGRPSAASLEVVRADVIDIVKRPKPLPDLTDEQAREWVRVVDALPADWFSADNFPLLAEYCRHIVKARRVAQVVDEIEAAEPLDLDAMDKAYKMAERESRALSSLATRMRITQHAITNHRGNKQAKTVKRPWES